MRRSARRLADALLAWRARSAERALTGRAVVFAPHYDDEVLGCGGTMIRRVRLGLPTRVVFMTDGSRSHRHLMPGDELARLRRQEAIDANTEIGLRDEDLVHLGYEDGCLREHLESASVRVAEVLSRAAPDAVFVPYRRDTPADHRATFDVVRRAVSRVSPDSTLFEYPVWFWSHWPRVPLEADSRRYLPAVFLESVVRNYYACRELDRYVEVEEVLPAKRAYLAAYRSQTTRLAGGERWRILDDMGDGEFLRCFFGPREYFLMSRGH